MASNREPPMNKDGPEEESNVPRHFKQRRARERSQHTMKEIPRPQFTGELAKTERFYIGGDDRGVHVGLGGGCLGAKLGRTFHPKGKRGSPCVLGRTTSKVSGPCPIPQPKKVPWYRGYLFLNGINQSATCGRAGRKKKGIARVRRFHRDFR